MPQFCGVAVLLVLGCGLAWPQQNVPTLKHAQAANTDPGSGAGMYVEYCAVCHGLDGKGNGPAAPALRRPPADLTQLARQNGGHFPWFRVSHMIQGDSEVSPHGSREMPVWGDVFRGLQRDEAMVKLRIHNITQYLVPLQLPATPAAQPAPTNP